MECSSLIYYEPKYVRSGLWLLGSELLGFLTTCFFSDTRIRELHIEIKEWVKKLHQWNRKWFLLATMTLYFNNMKIILIMIISIYSIPLLKMTLVVKDLFFGIVTQNKPVNNALTGRLTGWLTAGWLTAAGWNGRSVTLDDYQARSVSMVEWNNNNKNCIFSSFVKSYISFVWWKRRKKQREWNTKYTILGFDMCRRCVGKNSRNTFNWRKELKLAWKLKYISSEDNVKLITIESVP